MYVKPERVYVKEERVKGSAALKCFGLFFTILLLLLSIGYLITSLVAVFDRQGREVYFENNPQRAYTFLQGKELKLANPSWVIRTDDWGYIYRAYQRENDPYWSQYDVFLYIVVTAAVTTFLWVLVTLMDLYKYIAWAWKLATVTLILALLAFIFNLAGSAYIFYRICMLLCYQLLIDKFDDDNSYFWDQCNCPSFRQRYYLSIQMYFFAVVSVLAIALIHLIIEAVFLSKRPAKARDQTQNPYL
eukprot:TRINITY_DN135304_c1_g1_i1.p2 TRINITY_DN135304_c1_g1~~TRINITY_DN135304_c1_g1_i1.p2  ORF type:complete len:245 (-),score=7.32 TRINITY_DN135304_c1_g1_i1:81-815(-)